MEFMTTTEAATLWGISSRRITTLCNEGRVQGATNVGRTWLIPKGAKKPEEHKRGRKAEKAD
jgi:excisionase family DNA binding protein